LVWLKRTKARRKGAEHLKIVGCDLHTRYQQIAMLDTETGELTERRLEHESGQARAFYAGLEGAVRVKANAAGRTNIVVGAENKRVYFYNSDRVVHEMSLKDFMKESR
jgi:hypothetical protein